MRPVTDELLLGISGVTATVIGLFLVGVFFYVEAGMRHSEGSGRAALGAYMRAGTRIVLLLFAMALLLPLALVAFDLFWSRALFVAMGAVLVVANVDTAVRVRAASVTGTRTLLANEIAGTVGVAAIVVLPWARGGLRPDREDLTLSALIALATAFVSVAAIALTTFDIARLGPPDQTAAAGTAQAAGRLVFVTGTAGLDPSSVADLPVAEQLALVWSNIRRTLAAAGMTLDDVVRVTSFLRDPAYAGENAAAQAAALGERTVPALVAVADSLADGWLVDVEVVAHAGRI